MRRILTSIYGYIKIDSFGKPFQRFVTVLAFFGTVLVFEVSLWFISLSTISEAYLIRVKTSLLQP